MPAVLLEGVRKQFDDVVAIDGITLDLPRGAILGLIGPSGSGKTTTIRTVTGGIRPDDGRVQVLGEDPRRFRQRTRERIGYMPQQFLLYPDLTAGENVDFVGAMFGMLWRRRRRRVREALQLVELWDARKRRASRLSGGMQRRLELACALVHEPELLLLDEPTSGIDPILRRTIWEEFRRLRDAGRSLLVTTQYVGEAEHCDRVALIASGHVVAYGTPEQLRRQAVGGEMLRVETRDPVDARALTSVPEVTSVRQVGPREMLVVASNAGTAAPRIVDAVGSLGSDVVSSREERPTFDEIFAALVAAHERAMASTGGGGTPMVGRWR